MSAASPSQPRPESGAKPSDYERLLAYAFAALARRALSAAELEQRLLRRTDDAELAAQVLARVQELGYQDDSQVAAFEARRKGAGAFKLRQKMRQRGLEDSLIEEALAERDPAAEEEEARALLQRRLSTFARRKNPRGSAYAFLARRGYSSDLVSALIDEVASELPLPEYPARGGWRR